MLEELLKKYKIEEFIPLYDYVKKLDSEPTIVLHEDKSYCINSRTIQFKIKDTFFKIAILTDDYKKWFTFYRYNIQNEKIEKFAFILYSDEYMKNYTEEMNRFVQYSAIKFEDDKARTINYCYSYIDNDFITGWKSKRTISYEDGHMLVATGDDLANLNFNIKDNRIKVYDKSDENIDKVKKLEFYY